MTGSSLRLQIDGEIAEIALARPDKRNAVNEGMCAGRRYRVIGMFDIRDARGKQLLSANQRNITRPLKLPGSCK